MCSFDKTSYPTLFTLFPYFVQVKYLDKNILWLLSLES